MAVLWCGGEDIDFPNGSGAANASTGGRTGWSRCADLRSRLTGCSIYSVPRRSGHIMLDAILLLQLQQWWSPDRIDQQQQFHRRWTLFGFQHVEQPALSLHIFCWHPDIAVHIAQCNCNWHALSRGLSDYQLWFKLLGQCVRVNGSLNFSWAGKCLSATGITGFNQVCVFCSRTLAYLKSSSQISPHSDYKVSQPLRLLETAPLQKNGATLHIRTSIRQRSTTVTLHT